MNDDHMNYKKPPVDVTAGTPKADPYVRPVHMKLPVDINKALPNINFTRRSDVATLIRPGGVGVELGVAEGMFSAQILERSQIGYLYSVDMWSGDRNHDVNEYKKALLNLDKHKQRNSCFRMRFDEALNLFPDGSLDFIYIDGYAHTGEENGQTLRDWWPKLKSGGVFAGDDYAPHWPLVMKEVDAFAHEYNLMVILILPEKAETKYSYSPSWMCVQPHVFMEWANMRKNWGVNV